MSRKAFKYRIYPNQEQEKTLNNTLATCRYLYNNALEARVKYYRETKKSLSYVDQANALSKLKNPYQQVVHSQVLQDTLKRLDKAYKAFFNGLKKKQRVGFPRFKSKHRFNSFCYTFMHLL